LALGGHQAHLQLAAAPAFAHYHVAKPLAAVGGGRRGLLAVAHGAALPSLEPLRATPREHELARLVAARGGQQAVFQRHHLARARCSVKAADQCRGAARARAGVPVRLAWSTARAAARAERVLELVAVAPALLGGHCVGPPEAVPGPPD